MMIRKGNKQKAKKREKKIKMVTKENEKEESIEKDMKTKVKKDTKEEKMWGGGVCKYIKRNKDE